jgi:hypothetical protein
MASTPCRTLGPCDHPVGQNHRKGTQPRGIVEGLAGGAELPQHHRRGAECRLARHQPCSADNSSSVAQNEQWLRPPQSRLEREEGDAQQHCCHRATDHQRGTGKGQIELRMGENVRQLRHFRKHDRFPQHLTFGSVGESEPGA